MPRRKSLTSYGSLKDKLEKLTSSTTFLRIEDIVPSETQPRRYFDQEKLLQLQLSIEQHGVLEPVLVRPFKDKQYQLIAGERRYRAAIKAGLEEIPVVIRNLNDNEATRIALVENLQREDLNPFEETEGIIVLISSELGIPIDQVSPYLHNLQHQVKIDSNNVIGNKEIINLEQIFTTIGKMTWQSFVNNRLPILNLPNDLLKPLREGKLAYTKARAIAIVDNIEERQEIILKAINENLSLSEVKKYIKLTKESKLHENFAPDEFKKSFMKSINRLKNSKVWLETHKQKKLLKLLSEINKLID